MGKKSKNDTYGDREAQRRFDAALRGARVAGHKPQAEMRKGKAKPKRAKRGK